MKRLILALVVACGPSKPPAEPTDPSVGNGSAQPTTGAALPAACVAVRGKVQQLYRAEAVEREPKRVDDAVADNSAMVMGDCARDPAKVSACIAAAGSIKDLEASCLAPLDDEGTEGDRRAR